MVLTLCLLITQVPTEDAKEILPGHAYHWKDWFFCRGRDCLYAWNDYVVLELSNGSNGWFRFMINDKLSTMYSSGSPEGQPDTSKVILLIYINYFILHFPIWQCVYFKFNLNLIQIKLEFLINHLLMVNMQFN